MTLHSPPLPRPPRAPTRARRAALAPALLAPALLARALLAPALLAPALLAPALLPASAAAKVIDRVVAVVNDEIITLSELEELILPLRMRLQSIADPLKRDELLKEQRQQALEQLIGQRLLLQTARQQGVMVPDEQVEGHLQSVMQQQGWGEDELRAYLAAQGMTREALKEQSREFLMQQLVTQRNLAGKMSVSEGDIESAYRDFLTEAKGEERVEGAHLLLPVPAGSSAAEEAATQQRARELLLRARAGERLDELLSSLRTQEESGGGRAQGGDLGVITRGGGLPAELEEAFFGLKEGEVGGPVRTAFGYHLAFITRRAAQTPPPLEEVRAQLEGRLRQDRFQEGLKEWLERLKTSAFIERRL